MNLELDEIDRFAVDALDGYLVRKDLVRTFSRQFPVPTYVVEFLLGRYCASVDPDEIEEGLEVVQRQLQSRTVKAGEQELFKSRAREQGQIKLIDLVTARLDTKTDSYLATLPSLQLKDVRISAELVSRHERMLTGGFYAEITTDSGHKASAFFKYFKGFMLYANENDAIIQQLLHTIGRASRLKVEMESWEEELERLVALTKSRDTKW